MKTFKTHRFTSQAVIDARLAKKRESERRDFQARLVGFAMLLVALFTLL